MRVLASEITIFFSRKFFTGKTKFLLIFLGDATEYSKHLFRVLDTDNDSMVSWKEVMLGFHHLSPNGDPDQKLKIVYSVSTFKTPIFEI